MKNLFLGAAAFAATLFLGVSSAQAETTECAEITSIPTVITVQGVYCLKSNLSTNITSGAAITIATNNVTIDLNGWKLGGLAAGDGTNAFGIFARNRKNIILRNGSIRGFKDGVRIDKINPSVSSGHSIEDILFEGNRRAGIWVEGNNNSIHDNKVINTGPGSIESTAYGIFVFSGTGNVVRGNIVSGVDETINVWGIRVTAADESRIERNDVSDLVNAQNIFGLIAESSNKVVLKGNAVTTQADGDIGIDNIDTNKDVACIGNESSGFTLNFEGCDVNVGNVAF